MQDRIERVELKALVGERVARAIREELLPVCCPDPHNGPGAAGGYAVTSLYLDTPDLELHRAERRNEAGRLKLRIRTYAPDGPAHLEVKRRVQGMVDKTRVAVARDGWNRIVTGHRPAGSDPAARAAVEDFAFEVARLRAEPTLLVRYERMAYACADDGTRVTFDRRIEAQRACGWELDGDADAWSALTGLRWPVLLEIKCERTLPDWVAALVRRHRLSMQRFSKYARGIVVTPGPGGMAAAPDVPAWAARMASNPNRRGR